MAIIFCQSAKYRDINIFEISRLTPLEALAMLRDVRWGSVDEIECPFCGAIGKHRFKEKSLRWRCKSCYADFSITSGTILANRRLPLDKLLMAMFLFVTSPKSLSANQSHPVVGVVLRTMYINCGKFREALWQQRDLTTLIGIVHIDGGHFAGKPRRANNRTVADAFMVNARLRNRKAAIAPLEKGQSISKKNREKLKNRRVVLVMRQVSPTKGIGGTRTRIVVVPAEIAKYVVAPILANVGRNTIIMTDESPAYSRLSAWYPHEAVCHKRQYVRPDGVNQNQAEAYFARMRRAEFGVLHGMRHQYVALYANEFAWREDVRHLTLRQKLTALMRAVFKSGHSVAFRGYNQGRRLLKEFDGLP